MIIKDKGFIIDEVEWIHRDKNGKIIKRYTSNTRWNRILKKLHLKPRNCITYDGMRIIAGLMVTDVGDTAFDYMGIGTGAVGATAADRVLGNQISRLGGALCTGTLVQTDPLTVLDTTQWVVVFSKANDVGLTGTLVNVTEVGIFKNALGVINTMLLRQTFAAEPMNWDAGDTITFTVKVQVKQG